MYNKRHPVTKLEREATAKEYRRVRKLLQELDRSRAGQDKQEQKANA